MKNIIKGVIYFVKTLFYEHYAWLIIYPIIVIYAWIDRNNWVVSDLTKWIILCILTFVIPIIVLRQHYKVLKKREQNGDF